MKPTSQPNAWPTAVPAERGRLTRGLNNLSALSQADRAKAFSALKQQQPDIAEAVARMGRAFGKVELFVDQHTAQRLGVTA